jgi:CrcB protein
METVLAIAAGGALGSVLRHFLNNAVVAVSGPGFPAGIFVINVLGSFIMGVLVALFAHFGDPRPSMKVFLTTGILGGFTTFSTFSLDAVMLFERGAYGLAAFYIMGSVGFALAGLCIGQILVRTFAA